MSPKYRRILRIALIALVVVLFAGYFAFATFLFNPLEDELAVDNGALVPRDVDFFLARAQLDEAISEFPRLAVQDKLHENRGWRTWVGSSEYADLNRKLKIEETLATLAESVKQIPLGMQPQQVFGGKDLVVAGYFNGRDIAQADWAVYGRANWAGKLSAAMLFHPRLLGLEKRGIVANAEEKVVSLKGGGLPRELFIGRIKDVVIVATKKELVLAAHDFESRAYADSFYQSAVYADHILNAKRSEERDEIEFFVNGRKLLEELQFRGPWPDTKNQDFGPAFLGRLMQVESIKSAVGLIGLERGFNLDMHGELSSELLTPEQEKLYRQRGFDHDTLLDQAARFAPADTAFFAYGHAGIGETLRLMLAACEPALRTNLEDAIRNTNKYQNLEQLVNELDGALKGRFAIIVRANDYPPDPSGPPHDDQPVPAVAVVLWHKNVEAINLLRETLGGQGAKIGLKGKNGEAGFYKNYEAGFETREYWSEFTPVPGMNSARE